LGEIGREQRLDHGVLLARAVRPADQAMGGAGVGRQGDGVEVEDDAFLGPGLDQGCVHRLQLQGVLELAGHIGFAINALLGKGRVQLIGPPDDQRLDVRPQGHGRLHPPPAQIAPGTDDVGDEVDQQRLAHGGLLARSVAR
jgi:hypothetical protein